MTAQTGAAPPCLPSVDECETNALVDVFAGYEGRICRAFACWYPQMGGYTSRCVIVLHEPPDGADHGCFDAYVWHGGQFPFEAEGRWGDSLSPTRVHHCNAQQFIDFGNLVNRLSGSR